MKRNDFFNISPPHKDPPLVYGDPDKRYERDASIYWAEGMDFEQITCPVNEDHYRAGERVGDLHVILPSPKVRDLMWTQYSELIVTDHVRSLFEDAGFTGFNVRPVTVEKVKYARKGSESDIPPLWEIEVTGKGGNAHPDSGIYPIEASRCEVCKYLRFSSYRNGIIVDGDEWDGSDFFTVNGYPRVWLITERVKDLIMDKGLVDCHIKKARDLEWKFPRPEDYY